MKYALPIALVLIAVAALASISHADSPFTSTLAGLKSAERGVADRSIADLRRAGPEGLAALLAEYDKTSDASLIPAIDAVAAQHDARWSRLYWYTNLDDAKSAAAAQHKPILYLRMLGKLTDEYSCANSRFFRTVLYANESVSSLLRDRFILVWASERPVPVVTIDYGDGRVLKRTLTGNSIHYILNARGDVIDALPGLYDPSTFTSILNEAAAPAVSNPADIRRHLESVSASLADAWANESAGLLSPAPAQTFAAPNAANANLRSAAKEELETPLLVVAPDAGAATARAPSKLGVERPILNATGYPVPASKPAPHAAQAAGRAVGKGMAERPLVRAVVPPAPAAEAADADSPIWSLLAARHAGQATLDAHSIALIRSQNPSADPAETARTVDQFQRAIAADTVRNNLLFRREIVSWLLASPTTIPLESLNQRVYAELFLTPRSDPWLGLVPESTYSALTNNGCSIH